MEGPFSVAESVAAACYGVRALDIAKSRRAGKATVQRSLTAARQFAIYLAADSFGVRHADIAQRYRLHRTMVSKVLSKINRARAVSEELDEALDEIAEGLTAFNRLHSNIPRLLEEAIVEEQTDEAG